MTTPWLTVIIATYNRRDQVTNAIDSVLSAGNPGVEVICVDDCSSDDTVAFLSARYANAATVRVIASERRGGPSRARNFAIAATRSDWFLPLDSDCTLLPGGVDIVRDEITRYPDAQLLYFSCIAEPGGQKLDALTAPRRITHSDLINRRVAGEFFPVVSLETMRQAGLNYPSLRCGAESLLWLRLTRHTDAVFTARTLVKYGVTGKDRLCAADQQVKSASSLALAAVIHASILKKEGLGNSEAFRERLFAAGVYSIIGGATSRGRRLLLSACRHGNVRAAAALVASFLGARLFTDAFLRYRG